MASALALRRIVRGSVPVELEDQFAELVGDRLGQALACAPLARGQCLHLLRRLRIVAPVEPATQAVAVEDQTGASAPVVLVAPRLRV